MTSPAPTPDPRPASAPAGQAGPRRGDPRANAGHREPGSHGDPGHDDIDGNDLRGRTRHANRDRSGQGSPGSRHRRAGARHHDAGAQEGDRHDNRDGDRPGDARDQIRALRAQGGTYRSIGAAAGLAHGAVHDLASGRRPPTPNTARAIGKVTGASLRRARADAGGTRLRLRALHVMGHGSARIARALGVREATVRHLTRGDAATVSTSLRDAVADLYDAWWDKRAPERTRAERAAATAARRRAIAGNWCAGAGLDDDHLDTPGYKPTAKWKPATGTGTAPDVRPPARLRGDQRRGDRKRPAHRRGGDRRP
jgi:transcriptional regulator with XRE-family HTH domain